MDMPEGLHTENTGWQTINSPVLNRSSAVRQPAKAEISFAHLWITLYLLLAHR